MFDYDEREPTAPHDPPTSRFPARSLLAERAVHAEQRPFQDPEPYPERVSLGAGSGVRSGVALVAGVLAGLVLLGVAFVAMRPDDGAELQASSQAGSGRVTGDEADPSSPSLGVEGQDAGVIVASTLSPSQTSMTSATVDGDSLATTVATMPTSLSTTVTTAATTTLPVVSTAPSTIAVTTASTTASSAASPTSPVASTTASTVGSSSTAPSSTTTAVAARSAVDDMAIQIAVLDATNAERAKAGCGPLRLDPVLSAAADGHSEDMAARGYFSHDDLEGRGPGYRIDASGYPYQAWGENIAAGQRSAGEVVEDWMNSEGHRRNIVNCGFDELGVGYAEGVGTGQIPGRYWTQLFATRR